MTLPILEFLSLRTFSSVWYWIAVASVWTTASHRPLGVPYDMVWRARHDDAKAQATLDAVARGFAARLVGGMAAGGAVVVALVSAVLSALLILAVVYGLEFAQGLVLIVLPLSIVAALSVQTARQIDGGGDPARHLRRLRAATHAIAFVALFVTAFWGVYVNLVVSVLGLSR